MHSMIRHFRATFFTVGSSGFQADAARDRPAASFRPDNGSRQDEAGHGGGRGLRSLRRLVCGVTFLLLVTTAGSSWAQYFGHRVARRSGLIPIEATQRYGLKRAWRAQLEVDRSRGRLGGISLHVSSTKAHTVFELRYEGGKLEFSERQLDPFGKPVGVDGARKLATEKINELKAAKIESKLITYVVPEISLFAVTDRAIVQALDGETGRTRWSVRVGKRDYPTMNAAANDKFVAILNGTTLYLLDAETGRLEWQRDVANVPGAGAALSDDLVFAPMVNGAMEAYYLNDYLKAPYIFRGYGRAMVQPTVTATAVAWPTDTGHVYVGRANQRGIRFRLETNSVVASRIAKLEPNKLIVTSLDGFVTCLQEVSGDVLWRFSAGEPISQQAVAIGDSVYVVLDNGGMFCLDSESGQDRWWAAGVRRFVSASDNRIYTASRIGRIDILDRKTGGRIGSLPSEGLNMKITNTQTDRIYVGNDMGAIQCLREDQNTWPILHVSAGEKVEAKPEVQQRGVNQQPAAVQPKPRDPFGAPAGDDPFGAAAGGGAPADNDPFGAGAPAGKDPFGGGGSDDKNPFD